MEIKGIAFTGRKDYIIKEFGEDAWNKFIEKFSQVEPYFKNSIISTTSIPAEKFVIFQEAVIRDFYKGDYQAYWIHGESQAEFALVHGPYKVYLASKNIESFIKERLPIMWKMYFSEGEVETKVTDNAVDLIITGVPIKHVYFEYSVMAFAKKSLELLGARIIEIKKFKGPSIGTMDIHYQFIIEL